jgi:tetratricopeptide (TPR) repeat protein
MKAITSKLTAFLVLFNCLTSILQAQDRILTNVDSICKIALELPFERGIAFIDDNIIKCRNSGQASNCLLKLNFTAGYLQQMASNEFPDNQQSHLEKSIAYYQIANEIDRRDISIINNMFLVYKALGNIRAAINTLDQAIKVDPENRAKYDINKGDILYDSRDFKRAIESFKPAFFTNVNNEGLCWKIFDSYTNLSNQEEAFKGLYSFSNELFDQGLYDLARSGFLYALKNSLLVNNKDKAEQACIRWAEAISRKKAVTGSYVEELPDIKSWPSDCNIELQMLLTNSIKSIDNIRWWTSNYYLQHITASLLLKMESAALLDGDIKNAVRMLENALIIAPDFYVYNSDQRLKTYSPVKMDISIELARLYNSYPILDLNQAKFDQLIFDLFNEKSAHYLQNDLESIQKSHTILGLIYADRNVWKSSWGPANAIFQLEHAIEIQKKIENKNPEKFKPIPSLYQMLAKGYQLTNQPDKEYRTLIDAAVGYMDLDNLTMAESIVQNAKKIPSQDAEYNQKIKELGLITTMRLNIRNGNYDFKSPDLNALETVIAESELFKMTNEKKDNSFLNRQKFKIMADMGTRCSELNPEYKYPLFEIKALDYIEMEKALGNYQDINRLNQIQGKFMKNINSEDLTKGNQNLNITDVKDRSKSWLLNAGGYQTRIDVNPDLFIAGKVYEKITNEKNDKAIDGLNEIQINQGNVMIPKILQDNEAIDKAKIQQVKGVKKVQQMKIMPAQ